MPWQQYVADVSMEVDPDTGLLAYDEVVLTVPRQSGKSTFILAKSTHRASATGFFGDRQRVVYTAQTRGNARKKWEEDYVADLQHSAAFKSRVRVHLGNGNEHMTFANGSTFGIQANTETSGHGGTIDEAYIDEAFAQRDFRLEQAFGPAMITRRNKQLWSISTAGWLNGSPYLESKVRLGRAAVAAGKQSGLAYFEWSADEDCDPGDPAVWWSCMPALGWTITEPAIRSEYDKAQLAGTLDEFRRPYLNLWVPKPAMLVEDGPVNVGKWLGLSSSTSGAPSIAAFGLDAALDRSFASISAAGVGRPDKRTHLEHVESKPDVTWLLGYCIDLDRAHGPAVFAVDGGGPLKLLIPDMLAAGLAVVELDTADVCVACAGMVDAVNDGTIVHGPQPELDDEVKGLKKRPLGDGGFAFGRKNSEVPIAAFNAATFALFAATRASDRAPINNVW